MDTRDIGAITSEIESVRSAVNALRVDIQDGAVLLRDRFAMAALIALLGRDEEYNGNSLATAQTAYQYADAMLAARDSKEKR